jgi:hypothetical protein
MKKVILLMKKVTDHIEAVSLSETAHPILVCGTEHAACDGQQSDLNMFQCSFHYCMDMIDQ